MKSANVRDRMIPKTRVRINFLTIAALDSGGLMDDAKGIGTCAEITPKVAHRVKCTGFVKMN